MKKIRIDLMLLDRQLVDSIEESRALIMAGRVLVNDTVIDKMGTELPVSSQIRIKTDSRYVGRGGDKLEAALSHFGLNLKGQVCIDIGSSTGGFTDCMLQHGASKVYAVDSGSNQLDWKLRTDPRVISYENTNARLLSAADAARFTPAPFFCTMDLSFISVRAVLPAVITLLAPEAELLILVKPQFELPKEEIEEGGVVTIPALHKKACDLVLNFAEPTLRHTGQPFPSPVVGQKKGNQEFFVYFKRK